ncbi:MAG: ATP-binding cassette domain-containing protein [Clostridiales bacterium]|nr:ATP-binding cassette domain-containing protein [Clostridiales bacterium]
MLTLQNINKDYLSGDNTVHALRDVSINFNKNDFVAILGPSGCGKTTMLNIIGGLDRYNSGDLLINDKSTKGFSDGDWDTYRNNTIGFVFQSYNLISHLSVLANVEIALTLSGVDAAERKRRALESLRSVGLDDQANKKPNQLSGGQMQRVAIARALVNNPKILLADEPTGALDSATSEQIMNILQEISKDKLVIMVTHNEEIAEKYATRIVSLKDGRVVSDTKPERNDAEYSQNSANDKYSNGKNTSMSFLTAIKLSFNNLKTKKMRTILVSVAGSIGIIGIALILAINAGMTAFINNLQEGSMAEYPLTVAEGSAMSIGLGMNPMAGRDQNLYPDGDKIYSKAPVTNNHQNKFNQEYLDYINALDSELYTATMFSYLYKMNVLYKNGTNYGEVAQSTGSNPLLSTSNFFEIPDNKEFLLKQYDILAYSGGDAGYPSSINDVILVVDSSNNIRPTIMTTLGLGTAAEYSFNELLGHEFKVVKNDAYYATTPDATGKYKKNDIHDGTVYDDPTNITLKIVGIVRVKENATSDILSTGIGYTKALTDAVLADCASSIVADAQRLDAVNDVLTGVPFTAAVGTQENALRFLGAIKMPSSIGIYPKDFAAKEAIIDYLAAYNDGRPEAEQVVFTDLAGMILGAVDTLIDTIAVILMAFAAISLVVSSIMIGIITYVSVVERTKEIGILRSIGARKKDISRVFNAETLIIGFAAGAFAILMTLLLSLPINLIIKALVGVEHIASLPFFTGLILIAVSMGLTLIAGFIPSRMAAKKDPVEALRTD